MDGNVVEAAAQVPLPEAAALVPLPEAAVRVRLPEAFVSALALLAGVGDFAGKLEDWQQRFACQEDLCP